MLSIPRPRKNKVVGKQVAREDKMLPLPRPGKNKVVGKQVAREDEMLSLPRPRKNKVVGQQVARKDEMPSLPRPRKLIVNSSCAEGELVVLIGGHQLHDSALEQQQHQEEGSQAAATGRVLRPHRRGVGQGEEDAGGEPVPGAGKCLVQAGVHGQPEVAHDQPVRGA